MHASAAEAVLAMAGRLAAGDPAARFGGAAIDSRTIRGGELFFAFRGERVDGRSFVADAFARGAAGAVVESAESGAGDPAARLPAGSDGFLIEVGDVGDALVELARSLRDRAPEQLAGITGSAGKTTTKELLAAMLARRFRVGRTVGNFNNRIGLPVSLLNVPDDTEWMVAEMGMSSAGELRELSLLARPDLAVFTVVRPAHLEFFDSVRAIAEAKAELLAGLASDGWVVANACDPEIVRIVRRHRDERDERDEQQGGRIIWYALGEPVDGFADGEDRLDLRALDVLADPDGLGSRFTLEVEGERRPVHLALHGAYNVENFLAAAAAAWSIGVPLEEILEVAAEMPSAKGRGEVHRLELEGGIAVLIDDSYNSNPDAVGKALAGAAGLVSSNRPNGRVGCSHRRVAILGDMLELGASGPAFHREAGKQAAALGFSPVVGVGELARELVAGAAAGGAEAIHFSEANAAAEWAASHVVPGDVVLVKGSRGVHLDRVVDRMRGEERA
ncbi:MAG: UDP-N-acetylmuramoyl-tripeptide--D-alanyl-D-alanine ligase [Acidobacteriota bacterium]